MYKVCVFSLDGCSHCVTLKDELKKVRLTPLLLPFPMTTAFWVVAVLAFTAALSNDGLT